MRDRGKEVGYSGKQALWMMQKNGTKGHGVRERQGTAET